MNIYDIPSAVEWTNWFNFMVLCSEKRLSAFIELGLYFGGFSGPFIDRARRVPHFSYIGFDFEDKISPVILAAVEETERAHLFRSDFLKPEAADLVEAIRAKSPGPVLIFIDGYHKGHEFEVWFERAHVGDYIAVHDFDPDNRLTGADHMRQKALDPYLLAGRAELYYPSNWMRLGGTLSILKTG